MLLFYSAWHKTSQRRPKRKIQPLLRLNTFYNRQGPKQGGKLAREWIPLLAHGQELRKTVRE